MTAVAATRRDWPRLDRRLQARVAARSLLLQGCWNDERMQNVGFAWALWPWLSRIERSGGPPAAESLRRHLEYFNTQPYMAAFVLGVTGRLEEELAAAPPRAREALAARVSRLKGGFGSGLAGLGDALFWATLRPVCAATAIASWLFLWTAGAEHPVAWALGLYLFLYNLPALWVRWRGIELGYRWGEGAAVELKRFRWQDRIRLLRRAGLAVAVALTLAALLVPPWSPGPSPWHLAVLAAALGARHWGMPTPRVYAASLLVSFAAALVLMR